VEQSSLQAVERGEEEGSTERCRCGHLRSSEMGEMAGMGRDGRDGERWRVDEIDGSRRSLELPLWPEDPAVVALETSLEMF
jgi:hypothetical protein